MDIDESKADVMDDKETIESIIETESEQQAKCDASGDLLRIDDEQAKPPESQASVGVPFTKVQHPPTEVDQYSHSPDCKHSQLSPENSQDSQTSAGGSQDLQPPADQSENESSRDNVAKSTDITDVITNTDSEDLNKVGLPEQGGEKSVAEKALTTDDKEAPADASQDESAMEVVDESKTEGEEGQSADDAIPQKRTRITNSKLMLKSLPVGLAADSLFEYQWPLNDSSAEYYMLQEQLSVFLDIKSFRRKYPDLERRQIDILERSYLKDVGVVTEMQCDLGLTALKSDDIAELMQADYPDKYEEYAKVLQKREEQRLAKKQQAIQEQHNATPQTGAVSKLDIKRLTARAIKSAASYNAFLSRERREERRHYFDIQTGIVQCAKTKYHLPGSTRPSPYPVALIPGQYTSYYHTYTPDELKYLPVKTALYNPPLRIDNPYRPLPADHAEEPPAQASTPEVMIPATVNTATSSVVVTPTPRRIVIKLADSTCCLCGHTTNRSGDVEKCIKCSQCQRETHPSCCELTQEMLSVVVTYEWMCMDCKVCVRCSDPGNEDKMIVCDKCDRGYHTFCVGLKSIPEESIWACPECVSTS